MRVRREEWAKRVARWLDSGLTAKENLDFHCIMYHIPQAERAERIKDVLELMDLTESPGNQEWVSIE